MGSFNFVCAVSGLPIVAGDNVKYLLLEQMGIASRGWTCYIDDRWFPRIFPVSAQYNDYGSIENIKNSLASDFSIHLLKNDIIEVDVGENEYHDSAVKKTMTLEELLNPIWEGRVSVSSFNGSKAIQQTMIREDVWNSICSMGIYSWSEKRQITLNDYKAYTRDYYNSLNGLINSEKELKGAIKELKRANKEDLSFKKDIIIESIYDIANEKELLCFNDHIGSGLLNNNRLSSCLYNSFNLIFEDKYSQTDINNFLDEIAEYVFVKSILVCLNKQWLPGHTGGQDHKYKLHKSFNEKILSINNEMIKKDEEDE